MMRFEGELYKKKKLDFKSLWRAASLSGQDFFDCSHFKMCHTWKETLFNFSRIYCGFSPSFAKIKKTKCFMWMYGNEHDH